MKTSTNKGFIIPLIIIIAMILVAGGAYVVLKNPKAFQNNPYANPPVANNSSGTPTSGVKTYTNNPYGFTFNYPSAWKITEAADKKSVRVDSDVMNTTVSDKPFPEYTVTFIASSTDSFGEQGTKNGLIRYDSAKRTLVDVFSTPVRCLPTQQLTANSVPSINYGGSMMSDPAHFESAVLTNKDYMIIIKELSESSGNQGRDLIFSSLKFINGVNVRIPSCNSAVNSNPQPSITVLSPNGGETYKIGDTVSIRWQATGEIAPLILDLRLMDDCAKNFRSGCVITYKSVARLINAKNLGYQWKITSDVLPGEYILEITENNMRGYGDTSDAPITITN